MEKENKEDKISVLMSVYDKEKPEQLDKALFSIYNQTLPPNEIVLVEDGPISEGLCNVISKYPELRIVKLACNEKLGRALAIGLKECRYGLIARMDSDDIAHPRRLELQYHYMKNHLEISAVGGDIAEFVSEHKYLRVKKMPTSNKELYEYGKLRNPLNHMTVMFRKCDIESVGSYQHFPLLEDYHLWCRLLVSNYKISNIPSILVEARLGDDFEKKRGGFKYFIQHIRLRAYQRNIGYTNLWEFWLGLLLSFLITMIPTIFRKFAYKILRKV